MKRTEHTQKWLDALRSGECEQTRATIKRGDAHCCIGVAASLFGDVDEDNPEASYTLAKEAMGLTNFEMWSLIHKNDGIEGEKPHAFPEIADAIEQMLNGN